MKYLPFLFVGAALLHAFGCGSDDDSKFKDGTGDADGGGDGSSGGPGGPGGSSGGFGVTDASVDGNTNCTPNLTGLVRDFRGKDVDGGHPDFQAFENEQVTKGLVKTTLGDDRKPVLDETRGQIASRESFDQWYRNVDGVNQAFEFVLPLQPRDNGVLTFASNSFFPIDDRGFGNSGLDDKDVSHNFHFTFELHLEFVYRGGETFTFSGDDDLWVFFNRRLGIDLGGLHPAREATVTLDAQAAALGIEKGKTYPLDVFHAERRTDKSNFRIDTTLEFVNCSPILVPR